MQGETYLINLSVLALTFATVSALVMLFRQTMGGRLSNFDIYLASTFIAVSFANAIAAILPPLIILFEPTSIVLWVTSSGAAALLIGTITAASLRRRILVAGGALPLLQALAFLLGGAGVVVLLLNVVVLPWQGVALHALGITLSLTGALWAFARRISSLLGGNPGEDWDPKRG
jgi:hypothetical protein